VTGFTKSHEVALLIAAALRERANVVHLLGRGKPTLLLALLTERIRLDVTVTDAFPGTTVSFVRSRVTFVPVVMFCQNLLMLGAVLLAISKPTAAGVSAGTFWFVGHGFTSFRAKQKPPGIFPRWLVPLSYLLIIILT
jgi:hypothetical protein